MKCAYCGSTNVGKPDPTTYGKATHSHETCLDCGHVHIGGMLFHDRTCCDRVYQGGGGAEGSTEESRRRLEEARQG